MKPASLLNKKDGLGGLNGSHDTHIIGAHETWGSSDFKNQDLVILCMCLFRNTIKTGMKAEQPFTYDIAW